MMTGNHSSTPIKAPWNHIAPSASFFHWNQAVDPARCREVYDALHDSTSTSWPAAPRPTPLKVPAEPHRVHAFSSIRRHAPSSFLMASPTLLGRLWSDVMNQNLWPEHNRSGRERGPRSVNNPIMEHKARWPTEKGAQSSPPSPLSLSESRVEQH